MISNLQTKGTSLRQWDSSSTIPGCFVRPCCWIGLGEVGDASEVSPRDKLVERHKKAQANQDSQGARHLGIAEKSTLPRASILGKPRARYVIGGLRSSFWKKLSYRHFGQEEL